MKKSFVAGTVASAVLSSLAVMPLAQAHEAGDWLVRGGLTSVVPQDSSSNIVVGADLGVGVTVANDTQLSATIAYFLTDNWSLEAIAATPFQHDVNFSVADPLGTGDNLGDVTHLPPTLSVNYHFGDTNSTVRPYIGVGLNYTIFFDEQFSAANEQAGLADLSLDNSFGLAAQVGADWQLSERWIFNAAARWISIDTSATFNLNGAAGEVSDITIDPMVYTLSIGYRF